MNEEVFQKHHLKKTKVRKAVYAVLEKAKHPLTAEEVFSLIQEDGFDLSTVYRTLNTFAEAGLLKKEINEEKENIFALEKDEHILVCTECHKRIPLEGCPYHEVNEEIAKETGFLIQDQNTEIYGLCPDCQKKLTSNK